MSGNQRETESECPDRGRETDGDETFTMNNLASSEVAQPGNENDVDVVRQGTHGDGTFSMDMIASSEVAQTGNDSDVSVVPQGTQGRHGDGTFSMDMVASSEAAERQVSPGNGVTVVYERQAMSTRITADMSRNQRETESERPDRESETDGDETFTKNNLASSEGAQPGNDNDVDVVPQGTQGERTFSMDMVASSEVVERQASAGSGSMAVSERRERQAVSTKITAGSDFKGIIVQDSSDVSLSVGGQNDGIMKSDMLQMNLKRVKDVCVKTANYRTVKGRLEKYGHVTISGASGEGKTSIALMIGADLRNQGYELVVVDDVDKFELRNCDLRGKKVCLILDDIFGTVGLSTDVPHLRSILQNLKHYLEDAKSSKKNQRETHPGAESAIRVIFTTKSYNLECGVAKLEGQEYYFFTGPSLLDLTKSKSCQYSPQERRKILQKQLKHHNIDLDLDIDELCDTRESLFGFPLICTLFCEFLSFQKEPAQFFREPLFYLRQEIDMIMERRNDQSAALILMLVCEDLLNLSQVEMESKNHVLEAHLQAVKSVVPVTSRTTVAKAVRSYRGTFFTDGDILGFSHPTIYDACACALFKMNPSFVLNHCSIRFLYERVQAQQVQTTAIDNHLHIIYVSEAHYDKIASRLADAVAEGNYSMSVTHPILKNKQIVDKVFQMLKLKKTNALKRLLNPKGTQRLAMLHAKEEEKHLLYWAVHAHSLYLVEKILDVGYRFSDEEIKEAFQACASCGNEAVLLLLLSSKYKSLLHQSVFNKALVTATDNNYKGVALALLNIGADVFESKNDVGENVFQTARMKGFSLVGGAIFGFITKGLSIKPLTGDFDFERAAYLALCYSSCRGGNMLIIEDVIGDFDIDTRGLYGRTPLLEAARGDQIPVVDFLKNRNADVKKVDNMENSLLHVACMGGHLGMVKHVCPWFNIDDRDVYGWTPAMVAAVFGKSEVFDYLRLQGADLTLVDKTGDNLFTLALQGGCRQIIERLSPGGQYVKKQNPWTTLMRSVVTGSFKMLTVCHDNSPELVKTDQFGDSLLHLACRGGNRKCAEYLLPSYDINVRGRYNWTPVMMAAVCGHEDVFQLLVDHNADLALLSDTSECILTLAQRGQSNAIVECLRNMSGN
ncbi:uncharacterized protein LOC124261869 [Haliotis rubra]|uniref:uncharacterized protein LOC124261869 n=1 Tax=Haliotis rubra TaxID=36100 RepID=UPI001EE4F717|nr:uncharacterized protein LOC124261869 [Haliotis rubra]